MPIADQIYHQGFHIIDNFLELAHYQALRLKIKTIQNACDFKPAKIGQTLDKTHNTNIRKDSLFWLDKTCEHPAIKNYFAKLEALSEGLNQALFLGLIDAEAHFSIYKPNDFYKKHVDQFAKNKDRRISCIYYLNEDWQDAFGGELILYDAADQPIIKIKPQGNRFVCFNSEIPHEVSITHHTRYSIAAWLKVRPMMSTN